MAAAAVARVFALGETMGQTRALTVIRKEGWPAPTPAGWSVRTVHNILSNERYTGKAVFNGITLSFPAIVSPEQFQRVQALRATRKRESGPRDTSLLWAGHARCAVCGSAIGRDTTRSPYGHYVYYRCWRSRIGEAKRLGTEVCANVRSWPAAVAEEAWWAHFLARLADPALLPEMIPPAALPVSEPPPARVTELEEAIARAWAPYAAGKITGGHRGAPGGPLHGRAGPPAGRVCPRRPAAAPGLPGALRAAVGRGAAGADLRGSARAAGAAGGAAVRGARGT